MKALFLCFGKAPAPSEKDQYISSRCRQTYPAAAGLAGADVHRLSAPTQRCLDGGSALAASDDAKKEQDCSQGTPNPVVRALVPHGGDPSDENTWQRHAMVCDSLPAAITVFTRKGQVIHQNSASVNYMSDRTAARSATAAADDGVNVLAQLFALEPEKLDNLLREVLYQGCGHWRGIVRVPPRLLLGYAPDAWAARGFSAILPKYPLPPRDRPNMVVVDTVAYSPQSAATACLNLPGVMTAAEPDGDQRPQRQDEESSSVPSSKHTLSWRCWSNSNRMFGMGTKPSGAGSPIAPLSQTQQPSYQSFTRAPLTPSSRNVTAVTPPEADSAADPALAAATSAPAAPEAGCSGGNALPLPRSAAHPGAPASPFRSPHETSSPRPLPPLPPSQPQRQPPQDLSPAVGPSGQSGFSSGVYTAAGPGLELSGIPEASATNVASVWDSPVDALATSTFGVAFTRPTEGNMDRSALGGGCSVASFPVASNPPIAALTAASAMAMDAARAGSSGTTDGQAQSLAASYDTHARCRTGDAATSAVTMMTTGSSLTAPGDGSSGADRGACWNDPLSAEARCSYITGALGTRARTSFGRSVPRAAAAIFARPPCLTASHAASFTTPPPPPSRPVSSRAPSSAGSRVIAFAGSLRNAPSAAQQLAEGSRRASFQVSSGMYAREYSVADLTLASAGVKNGGSGASGPQVLLQAHSRRMSTDRHHLHSALLRPAVCARSFVRSRPSADVAAHSIHQHPFHLRSATSSRVSLMLTGSPAGPPAAQVTTVPSSPPVPATTTTATEWAVIAETQQPSKGAAVQPGVPACLLIDPDRFQSRPVGVQETADATQAGSEGVPGHPPVPIPTIRAVGAPADTGAAGALSGHSWVSAPEEALAYGIPGPALPEEALAYGIPGPALRFASAVGETSCVNGADPRVGPYRSSVVDVVPGAGAMPIPRTAVTAAAGVAHAEAGAIDVARRTGMASSAGAASGSAASGAAASGGGGRGRGGGGGGRDVGGAWSAPGTVGPAQSQTGVGACAEQDHWHEVWATRSLDPVTAEEAIVLTQHDVTAKVVAERHLALVMEAEHRLLEQLFPKHILTHVTEEWVREAAEAAASQPLYSSTLLIPDAIAGRAATRLAKGSGLGGAPSGAEEGERSSDADVEVTTAPAEGLWRPRGEVSTRHTAKMDCDALATWHPEVTLLFADIKGFTPMCEHAPPRVVMTMLNDLFSRFDSMLDKFGVFKVETIGDCYFVAGGLIHEDEDGMAAVRDEDSRRDPLHAHKVFMFAKAMLSAAREVVMPTTSQPVEVRIGIHSGPVVSGVVGTRMPRFCLFGDTVNTTSRMESTGVPGAIHASEAARSLLRSEAWQPTGGIQVKGKGVMQTFLWRPLLEDEDRQVPLPACAATAAAVAAALLKNPPLPCAPGAPPSEKPDSNPNPPPPTPVNPDRSLRPPIADMTRGGPGPGRAPTLEGQNLTLELRRQVSVLASECNRVAPWGSARQRVAGGMVAGAGDAQAEVTAAAGGAPGGSEGPVVGPPGSGTTPLDDTQGGPVGYGIEGVSPAEDSEVSDQLVSILLDGQV